MMNHPPSSSSTTTATTNSSAPTTSPLIMRRSTAVFQRNSATSKCFSSYGGKRYACPCLNLNINLSSSRDMKFDEWNSSLNNESVLFSKTQLDEFKIKYNVDCRQLVLTRGSSIAGIQSSLDIFMESYTFDESESIVKAFKCLNCEAFFGFYFEKDQSFLVNTTQLLDETAQEKQRQQEDYSKIFNIVPKTTNINTSDNLLKHPILVQYQKDMQKKLNDERISMELRIKEFMKNEKIQYQKLLLKTQTEKDTIFRKAKTILAESDQSGSFDTSATTATTGATNSSGDVNVRSSLSGEVSSPASAVVGGGGRMSSVSQEGMNEFDSERMSRSLSPSAVDEKIKKAISTSAFKPISSSSSLSSNNNSNSSNNTTNVNGSSSSRVNNNNNRVEVSTKPKFNPTAPDVDEDVLTQKSFHYKKMTSQLMSRTYTPSAFFSFDEEGSEQLGGQETKEEEEEDQETIEEDQEQTADQPISPQQPQQQQTRSRRRLEFSSKPPPVVVKPSFYGSSVPINITMRPQAQQQTAINEKLPLYYEATSETKPETPEQRKQRTKSFKTKPRLDDDPFTEVPQSYIERYMTFRDEYIQKIDTVPPKEEEDEDEETLEEKPTTTEEEHFNFENDEELSL